VILLCHKPGYSISKIHFWSAEAIDRYRAHGLRYSLHPAESGDHAGPFNLCQYAIYGLTSQ
jgi:hypothetical protein